MSWQDQRRDELGRFHNGSAPGNARGSSDRDRTFGRGGLSQRIQAVAYGVVGALPPQLRARASGRYSSGALELLTEAMTAWAGGARLSKAAFADRFFGRPTDDPVVEKLYAAILTVASASSHAELGDASRNVADAMKAIGLDGWPRFLASVQARAHDPETAAAVETGSLPPVQAKDVIRPVNVVQPAAGIGRTGIAGGTGAAGGASNANTPTNTTASGTGESGSGTASSR